MIFIVKLSSSQFIDRYGINVGASYSTQIWNYKLISGDADIGYKFGPMAFIQAEKDFGNNLALRTEFGYVQKGFKNQFELRFEDGTSAGTNNDNLILHNLALNLGLKLIPLKAEYSPYFLIGLRTDYMISYKDIVIEEQQSGLKFNMYESAVEEFNKFNLGGLLGLGFNLKQLVYLEVEFNPNITKSFNDIDLSVKDNSWAAKIGLNINELIK